MNGSEESNSSQPFRALIAASSIVVAILYLAGFAFRWAYYYNFGVQYLVFNFSVQSFLITSMEMIRQPENLATTVLVLGGTILSLNALISVVRRLGDSKRLGKTSKLLAAAARALGLGTPLVVDSVRALVILYVVYMLSSQMGYRQFQHVVVNSRENTLPVVTAVIEGGENEALPLACGKELKEFPNVIGDAMRIRQIQENGRTCTLESVAWRLLYRDEKSIYLFASQADRKPEGRPLTIVLPNTEKTVLVME